MKSFTDFYNDPNWDGWLPLSEDRMADVGSRMQTSNVGWISAFRGELEPPENRSRNAELLGKIRAVGFGFFRVTGHWSENAGLPNERQVEEQAFLVFGRDGGEDTNLRGHLRKWAREAGQVAILFKSSTSPQVMKVDSVSGASTEIGVFTLADIGAMFSEFRGRPFVLASIQASAGLLARVGHPRFRTSFQMR